MKQILLMAMLAAGMLLAGCSKDESNGMEFTISESSVSLLAHDDYKITTSGDFTARSSNEDVATVNADGVIHAVSAGDADIIFTSVENSALTQTCKVNVDWRYKYFDEPILDFTMSVEQVKERETHQCTSENLWDAAAEGFPEATNPFLVRFDYRNKEIPMIACYAFLDKERCGIGTISLEMLKGCRQKVAQQLEERYSSPSADSSGRFFFHDTKRDYFILLTGNIIVYSTKFLE